MGAIKDDLHKLIDKTEDEGLLKDLFMILSSRSEHKEGQIWTSLSLEQQQEVLSSESEIGQDSAWVSDEEMREKNAKWLR